MTEFDSTTETLLMMLRKMMVWLESVFKDTSRKCILSPGWSRFMVQSKVIISQAQSGLNHSLTSTRGLWINRINLVNHHPQKAAYCFLLLCLS